MKRQIFVIFASLSLLLMSVHAQSSAIMVANIPFDFIVRDKTLPAGEYTVKRAAQGVLLIQSRDRGASMFFTAITVESNNTRDELVFNHTGDKYFLSRVWTAGNSTGSELQKCRTERDLRLERISKDGVAPKLETVSVAARQR
ncbi:MAG TPA: hypothetical protein VGV87_24940 [Blastocatellia bacterium]|jgi:hypothetical protein|nr:hypothetical protein [Blastocatellia bacterium]